MSAGRTSCPSSRELSRAFPTGADEVLRRHLAACPACAAGWHAMERVAELARGLPEGQPTGERREDVRTALLATSAAVSGAAPSRRRWPWIAAGGLALVAAAVAGAWLTGGHGGGARRAAVGAGARRATVGAGARRATVHAQPHASFVLVGTQPDELVRLAHGTLTVEVSPLAPGERFRVVTADAEVEVRGTAFDVVAADDRLVAVRVFRGHVEVRPAGRAEVALGAGQRWEVPAMLATATATVPTESTRTGAAAPVAEAPGASVASSDRVSALSAPDPRTVREVRRERPARAAAADGAAAGADVQRPPLVTASSGPAEAAFDEGWRALRDGDPAGAAEAFGRAAAAGTGAPLAEDAAFWRAVALGRAGRDAEAAGALAIFLDRYPSSPRVGEASAMYGWILLELGELDAAEARFRAAAGDRVPAVRGGAQRGLEAVAGARDAGTP
ncbi:MAG: FecR domain-containing protein [Deltaproteobacteria bacterium]|nr:FecR domain-containing protein [Deltaproteobacteria bacterium]